ncbi:MAG: DUF3795 domain-containing protein [Candidatus Altiarchaeales archaeon]|nr:DUF3795 domain-containing protein [Candidatus Altiarchaeales archaeon]MBD3416323.1 DUF3795 domain-containing protein [Candidatus Altiarchaeales archaeon]
MTKIELGCCGAYCRTCREYIGGKCKGCKTGYATGERDIRKSKCTMKVCCYGERKLETCADCNDYLKCEKIKGFHGKSGYKYGKYREAIEYIRENGYGSFFKKSGEWKGAYGKLD